MPHEGNLRCLAVLVEFDGGTSSAPLYHKSGSTIEYYEEMLFSKDDTKAGWPSFRSYYNQNSRGKLDITGSVVGWYKAKHELSYYTGWNGGTGAGSRTIELISECIDYAEDWFDGDLIQFNNDGPDGIPSSGPEFGDESDKYIDVFLVIHSGKGSESRSDPDARSDNFHSHFSPGFSQEAGGVIVKGYSINGEYAGAPQDYFPGVFIHECGHWFGLPDLYDYGYDSAGVGKWSMMAAGSWSCTSFDAWSKVYLGWFKEDDGSLINIVSNITDVEIPDIHMENSVIYRLWEVGLKESEYFLVENRQRQSTGPDISLPGEGLLIWHVDESVPSGRPNDNQDHPLLKLLQCDGEDDLYYYRPPFGDDTDPWPCGNKDFDSYSNPSSRAYNGEETMVAVRNISPSGDVMTADFEVGVITEGIQVISYEVNDIFGNGDGIPNWGEEIYLKVNLMNNSGPKTGVSANISSTNPLVNIDSDQVYYGDMSVRQSSEGSSSYHIFIPSSDTEDSKDNVIFFNVDITADGYTQESNFTLTIKDPNSNVVFWDDLEGNPEDRGWKSKEGFTGWSNEWHVSSTKNYTPGGFHSFKFGDTSSKGYLDKSYGKLLTPEIILPENSLLTIRHWIDAENLSSDEAYDGGVVMIYKNGEYEIIEPERGYQYRISLSAESQLIYFDDENNKIGSPCYSGKSSSWILDTFDLSNYEGLVQIAFVFGSDDFGEIQRGDYEGWYIDDVLITSQKNIPPSPPIIKMAGYLDTDISVSNGGTLYMEALAFDPNGLEDIDSVEIYYNDKPTGAVFQYVDRWIHSISIEIPPLDPQIFKPGMEIPFTVVAKDKGGLKSVPWPHFRVENAYDPLQYSSVDVSDFNKLNISTENYQHFGMDLSYFPLQSTASSIRSIGYLDTVLTSNGGLLKIIARFNEDEADQISNVQIHYQNATLPFILNNNGSDGDFIPQDVYFTFMQQFNGTLPIGEFIFWFSAESKQGDITYFAPNLILN